MSLFGPPTIGETLLPADTACRKCGLYKTKITSPKISPYGKFKRRIMIIGEAPGKQEDRHGKPWQGQAGQLLERECKRVGLDLFNDCLSYNSINCRPITSSRTNRSPTNTEITLCRNHVLRAIYKYQPAVVLLLGGTAVQSVIGVRWTKKLGGITRWRGWTIPDRELNTWLCPIYHPSYIMRMDDLAATTVFRADLKQALGLPDPMPKYEREQDQVVIVEKTEDLIPLLKKAHRVAWDIETTGLKPYDTESHRIVAVAFAPDEHTSYAVAYPNLRVLRRILADRRIGKVAQHMKFESTWIHVLGKYEVRNQEWDTMLASHVLDNRPGITGLKFQAYVRFGLVGYGDSIEPYMKAIDEKDANSVNTMEKAMQSPTTRREVLTYCGVDALATFRLAMVQMKELGYTRNNA